MRITTNQALTMLRDAPLHVGNPAFAKLSERNQRLLVTASKAVSRGEVLIERAAERKNHVVLVLNASGEFDEVTPGDPGVSASMDDRGAAFITNVVTDSRVLIALSKMAEHDRRLVAKVA